MNRKRILFVDDEPAVLDALQNVLRKERRRWDMTFVVGAEQALAELVRGPVDAVVSDMRMPGMDGAALLARVRTEYPGAARIVLSGHADREAVFRALPVAHQFLSKPCDATVLRLAIQRTLDLHDLLPDPGVRRIVGHVAALPSRPGAYAALTAAASDPDAEPSDFARIIESDPGTSVKVLQLANSAYFGRHQRVVSIARAVDHLGIEVLRHLTRDLFRTIGVEVESQTVGLCRGHSLRAAEVARALLVDSSRADEAFTAALVHDVGRIVVALGLPSQFAQVTQVIEASGRPAHVVEKEKMGFTHAEVGAYLLGLWGLPTSIVDSIAHHHIPSAFPGRDCELLAAVHAADVLTDGEGPGPKDAGAVAGLDVSFIERAGLRARIDRWLAAAQAGPRPRAAGMAVP